MNRMQKEENKRYQEQSKGLNSKQIELLDKILQVKQTMSSLTNFIHCHLFSEESDFMYDSILDAADRKIGINPMNQDYITKTNLKRQKLGVKPLDEAGMCRSSDSKKVSRQTAERLLRRQNLNQDIKKLI